MATESPKATEMASRYKIQVPDLTIYRAVQEQLREQNVPIFVASEKRRLFSTGRIPRNIISSLEKFGATITEDHQYDLEFPRRA